jgi:predicted nucleic acid binding AN1-type Zn finger protein
MLLNKIVGYCGIVCSSCPIFLATQKDDDAERRRVIELVRKEPSQYGKECRAEDINCDGCLGEGSRLWRDCKNCKIRGCAKERNVENCAYCTQYSCETLVKLFDDYPSAKKTLDEIRLELSHSES